jgi:hypothetical protein
MSKQEEAWEVRYELRSVGDKDTVARGHIKDYPSAEEALFRLGERVATAVAAELRPLADPAPWRLVLSFEISRRADPLTAAELVKQLAMAEVERPNQSPVAAGDDDAGGIDLDEDLDED